MKVCTHVIGTILVLAQSVGAATVEKRMSVKFGPKNCVSLTKSKEGSCVISTNCEGVDISATEFAFDCVGEGGGGDVVRHSFGVGGFESSEEFDTEVKCRRCAGATHVEAAPQPPKPEAKKAAPAAEVDAIMEEAPAAKQTPPAKEEVEATATAKPPPLVFSIPPAHPAKKKPNNPVKPVMHSKRAQTVAVAKPVGLHASSRQAPDLDELTALPAKVVKYGPNDCISLYKSKEDHCIMSTDCKAGDIATYNFGLICVDEHGMPVKHMFGKDSFDPKETFDTLVKCKKCMGIDDIPDDVHLAGEVATMDKDIASLKAVMTNISINVKMLNEKVFPPVASAPAPAPAPQPAGIAEGDDKKAKAKEVEPAKALAQHHHRHHRRNLRHSHRRHHRRHYDDDDDDDEDRDDDRYEDEDREERRYDHEEDREPEVREEPKHVSYTPLNNVEQAAAEMMSGQHSGMADDDDDEGDDA